MDGLLGPWGLRPVREALLGLSSARSKAVLVLGETGTGKELVAAAAAKALGRAGKSFCSVNVAALSPNTIEGHLFGCSGAPSPAPSAPIRGSFARPTEAASFSTRWRAPRRPPGQAAARARESRGPAHRRSPAVEGRCRVHRRDAPRPRDLRPGGPVPGRSPGRGSASGIEGKSPPLRKRPEDLLPLLATLWERQSESEHHAGQGGCRGHGARDAPRLPRQRAGPGEARALDARRQVGGLDSRRSSGGSER